MRRRTGLTVIVIAIVAASFGFLVPLIPSTYPISQEHLFCPSPASMCDSTVPPKVYGSITYSTFGYGGVMMPDHAYLLITSQTLPPVVYGPGAPSGYSSSGLK